MQVMHYTNEILDHAWLLVSYLLQVFPHLITAFHKLRAALLVGCCNSKKICTGAILINKTKKIMEICVRQHLWQKKMFHTNDLAQNISNNWERLESLGALSDQSERGNLNSIYLDTSNRFNFVDFLISTWSISCKYLRVNTPYNCKETQCITRDTVSEKNN